MLLLVNKNQRQPADDQALGEMSRLREEQKLNLVVQLPMTPPCELELIVISVIAANRYIKFPLYAHQACVTRLM